MFKIYLDSYVFQHKFPGIYEFYVNPLIKLFKFLSSKAIFKKTWIVWKSDIFPFLWLCFDISYRW